MNYAIDNYTTSLSYYQLLKIDNKVYLIIMITINIKCLNIVYNSLIYYTFELIFSLLFINLYFMLFKVRRVKFLMTINSKSLSSIPIFEWVLTASASEQLKCFLGNYSSKEYNLILISLAHKSYISQLQSNNKRDYFFNLLELLLELGKRSIYLFSISKYIIMN